MPPTDVLNFILICKFFSDKWVCVVFSVNGQKVTGQKATGHKVTNLMSKSHRTKCHKLFLTFI